MKIFLFIVAIILGIVTDHNYRKGKFSESYGFLKLLSIGVIFIGIIYYVFYDIVDPIGLALSLVLALLGSAVGVYTHHNKTIR